MNSRMLHLLSLLLAVDAVNSIVNRPRPSVVEVLPGVKYIFNSPNYPDNYSHGGYTVVHLLTDHPIELDCPIFDIPESQDCSVDAFYVSDGTIQREFCSEPVGLIVKGKDITLSFASSEYSPGGKFSCHFMVHEKKCTVFEFIADSISGNGECEKLSNSFFDESNNDDVPEEINTVYI